MSEQTREARLCLTELCKAARRRDRVHLQSTLTRFNALEALQRIALTPSVPWLTSSIQVAPPTLEEQLPNWMRQTIRDQGLKVGKDLFIKKGPGTIGIRLEVRF